MIFSLLFFWSGGLKKGFLAFRVQLVLERASNPDFREGFLRGRGIECGI